MKLCEKLPFMVDLKIEDFHNSDETKRHIPSKQVCSIHFEQIASFRVETLRLFRFYASSTESVQRAFMVQLPPREQNEDRFQAEPSVIVTLGIGQDTRAEEALRKVIVSERVGLFILSQMLPKGSAVGFPFLRSRSDPGRKRATLLQVWHLFSVRRWCLFQDLQSQCSHQQ